MRIPSLVFGVLIDDITMAETLDAIDDFVANGRRSGHTHQIATVNVDFLVNALHDASLQSILQSTSLNIPDGRPLLWGGRLSGLGLRERVAGADLVPQLAAQAADRGWRVHFFGSAPGVADRALAKMLEADPRASLTVDGGPLMDDVRDTQDPVVEQAIEQIRSVDADILCVALGNPKQEHFIATHRDRLGVPVMIGVGGALDMYVGDKKRAPLWAQRSGAEFLFRAAQEPSRLGPRYARDARVFLPRFARYARTLRKHAAHASLACEMTTALVSIESSDRLSSVAKESVDLTAVAEHLARGADLSVDLREELPGTRAIVEWMAAVRSAHSFGRRVTVTGVTETMRRTLLGSLGLPADAVDGDHDPASAR